MQSCVNVHPTVLFNIVDSVIRKAPGSPDRVIGTLLGADREGVVEVQNSFPVSHREAESMIALDTEFHKEMVALSHQVSSKEVVVGWYSTGAIFPLELASMVNDFYAGSARQPVYLNVDTNLTGGNMSIKAYILGLDKTSEEKKVVITEIPCHIHANAEERRAVNALVQTLPHDGQAPSPAQPSNLEAFEVALRKMVNMIDVCQEYVAHVLDGSQPADDKIGHLLMHALNSVPTIDVAAFEKSFDTKVQELLMTVYLANLAKAQLALAEKLQTF